MPDIEDKTGTNSQSGHEKLNKDLNWDTYSVQSHELFEEGKDDIVYEGELMKFKPGLTINFIPRYVQISKRAFRYFRNKSDSYTGRPIASIRKAIIRSAEVIEVNKNSYLKPGSAIAKSGKEDALFSNMFEITLNQDYEDNCNFRKQENEFRARK